MIKYSNKNKGWCIMIVSLPEMKKGRKGTIVEINCSGSWANRPNVIGIRNGKQVSKITRIFRKGPAVFRVGDMQIAISRKIASKIFLAID